ncbi:hypothetical protein GCM10009846_28980 [Agrococcus versicolor]|uniref:Uncharacterized protein n=2 Tax=Agrococcus versicolor TaxID=501482 RepID=A0ABP5MQ60_9MICO
MRTATLPALVAIGLLSLAGCSGAEEPDASAEPSASASPSPSAPASEPPASGAPPSDAPAPEIVPGATEEILAGTTWFGTAAGVAEVTFTFAADGTVDFSSFNGEPFDAPTDVWSVDDGVLSLTISQLQAPSGAIADIVFTGPAATGGMELTGDDGSGTAYAMTIAQV